MKNRIVIVLATSIMLSLLVAACTQEATDSPIETTPVESGLTEVTVEEPVVLRVGGMARNDCWNPFSCTGIWNFGHLVIEGLSDRGSNSSGCEGVPRLAESWQVSEDGRTWTVKLHEGITFSDGTPFTAETAKWNFEWYAGSESLFEWFAETWDLQSVEVIDELTFKYTTADPIINSPDYDWVWWYMLNPNQWGDVPEEDLYTFEAYPPIGTGPYMVTEDVPGSYIIYDDRPEYYQGDPPIDRVVYSIYANADAIVSALITGEIDLTTPWMPPETYDALASDPNITVEEKEPYAGNIAWLVFNVYEAGVKNPAIDDPEVREAIDYAIDKQQIVDIALLGHGVVLPTSWNGVTDKEISPDLEVTPYDPIVANQLLDNAGYLDTDGDGIRETSDGIPLELSLVYPQEYSPAFTMSNMIAEWLGQIGIDVAPEAQEIGSFNSIVLDQHAYDMAISVMTHDIDAASMDFWFSCWSAESGSNSLNFAGYCNAEVDDLVSEYWFNTDLEARWEPMYEAQRILAADRPIITLAGQNSIQAYRNDRFEFPMDTCDVGVGMFDPLALLKAVVK
jgi:peptide/nickel transport system substrate-binding protein